MDAKAFMRLYQLIEYVHLTFTWLDPSGLKHIVEIILVGIWWFPPLGEIPPAVIIVLGDASIP